MAVTPEKAARILGGLARDLEQRERNRFAEDYAKIVLEIARQKAASKPSPQSRMAAEVMGVQGSLILPRGGGAAAAVSVGSEFGSHRYTQFPRVNRRGYWLYPAVREKRTEVKADLMLQGVIDQAVRRG